MVFKPPDKKSTIMENRRIIFNRTGDTKVLEIASSPLPQPTSGQVRIRHQAIGINFIDTYHRSGLYPLSLPSGLGLEAAGIVDAVGEGVTLWHEGDPVVYCSGPLGAYSDYHCVDSRSLMALPENITAEQGAAIMLKGLTVAYLLHKTASPIEGDWIVVHAAAGGVGQLLCRWASAMGVRVIGTVGSQAKIETALSCGCESVIKYREENVPVRVKELTGGHGVKVVYDGVGKDTFMMSLDSLQPRGLLVSFGNASGAVPDFSPLLLAQKGSLYITRPTLMHYTSNPIEFTELATLLTRALQKDWIKASIYARYPLAEAGRAHQDLESGRTQGSLVLLP